ncbi:MAG: iron-sulfur cluster assembly accessory protein [Bdellovibrionaceae bacterium]|nr:iron-sulfur cluster assembly accessory protein [Pseudobdellovibrionaceae bacterium]
MIQISESAAGQISRLKSEDPKAQTDSFLRVKVVAGGCSGMSYKLEFDQALSDQDKLFEQHGTKVVVDKKSLLYVAGMTLDFEGGLNGKGFVFSNPNASKTCGCGSSFGV